MKGNILNPVREDVAIERTQLILPLLDPDLAPADRVALQNSIAQKADRSYRTIGRWVKDYKRANFTGLMPKAPPKRPESRTIEPFVLEEAIKLRLENPMRSVESIIWIMEQEGTIDEGTVARSTLQRYLTEAGYSSAHLRKYMTNPAKAVRRFQKNYRMQQVQGDIKYGPYLPIGKDGKMVRTYWVAWIDDATRYITHAFFYEDQVTDRVLDSFRQMIEAVGIPTGIHVDNGVQYRSRDLRKVCSRLGIQIHYAKEYSPQSKGKVERMNFDLNRFMAEAKLQKCSTLEELNIFNQAWIEKFHQKAVHSALNGMTPEDVFWNDTKHPLKMVSDDLLDAVFMRTVKATVHHDGTINFNGCEYQVDNLLLCDHTCILGYYPDHMKQILVYVDDDLPTGTAEIRKIGENIDYSSRQKLDPRYDDTEGSRLLRCMLKFYDRHHPDACVFERLEKARRSSDPAQIQTDTADAVQEAPKRMTCFADLLDRRFK